MYARPESVEEALSLLARERWSILAGGTDFYPALGDRKVDRPVLDLSGLGGLRGIQREAMGWRIGALTTWTDVIRADLPAAFDALKQAAREVGSVQIQNAGTLGGNLCNASPAADGVPPLLTLDAMVTLTSAAGTRDLPLGDFITGARRTALAPGEILTDIRIPEAATSGPSTFLKLGARKYLVISISMVAARLVVAGGTISDAALSVGACSAVARRLPDAEDALAGRAATADAAEAITDTMVAGALAPIDDIRADAAYRAVASAELVRRAVAGLLANPREAAA